MMDYRVERCMAALLQNTWFSDLARVRDERNLDMCKS